MTAHAEVNAMLVELQGEPVWRFLSDGTCRHLLPRDGAPIAACGHRSWAAWEWLGTSDAERQAMRRLRPCLGCVRMSGCPHVVRRSAGRAEMPWSWGRVA
ncbi:hypothetical protein AB0F72_09440 [Actinoplanes sp. NPDC023936]|uniref:hypothetical protein n=1 Tax=Actinoplanes sp. NPDC023936 TaxID=3154910 RepID=UPI003411124C